MRIQLKNNQHREYKVGDIVCDEDGTTYIIVNLSLRPGHAKFSGINLCNGRRGVSYDSLKNLTEDWRLSRLVVNPTLICSV